MAVTETTPEGERLRPELEADHGLWGSEIEALLRELTTTNIYTDHGRFAVLDATYDHIGKYAPYPDTTREQYTPNPRREKHDGKSVSFAFNVDARDRRTYWMRVVNTIDVTLSRRWNADRTLDGDGETEDDFTGMSDREEKYIINGYLIDTAATSDPVKAAAHIEAELAALSDRIRFLADLERFARVPYGADESDPDAFTEFTSPINVRGVGEATEQKYARWYGVPSNIVMYGERMAGQFLSSSWGTQPDRSALWENVTDATRRYYEFHDQGETGTDLTPDALFEYPKPQADRYSGSRLSHHSDLP